MRSRQTTIMKVQQARGAALIITLLLLALLSAASLAMVLLVSSDTMINGYYQNYRGSFYAADSGVNAVVEGMKNAVQSTAVQTANPPLPNGIPPSAITAYAQYQAGYNTVSDANSWHSQFKVIANPAPFSAAVLGTPTVTQKPNPNDPNNPADQWWTYTYPFTVTVQGQSAGSEAEVVTETGFITYSSISGSAAAGGPPSFSKWGAFIDQFNDCQGPLVEGTMTGPFFTNGQWNFGNYSSPGYTFTDPVGQAGANVSWWKTSRNCVDSPTAPNGFKQPNFQGGLQTSQNPVTPPSNSYNQAQAVMDGKGAAPCTVAPCSAPPPPSKSQMNATLKTISGTAYPSSGNAPNGVYIPYYTSGVSPSGAVCTTGKPCFGSSIAAGGSGYGGGFYVQGNASVTLSATTGCGGGAGCNGNDPTQTYTITQGSTVTTIVVDNSTGNTIVNGTVLQGVPTQLDPNTGTPITQTDPSGNTVNPTLVYVNGQITGLNGPYASNGNSLPAIQNNTGVTIAASSDINITGNLEYAESPVSVPADALNASTDAGVLGIYTTGNINLYPDPKDANGNLTVNASLAAIGSGNSVFATPGGSINTWTIVGGRAEDHANGVRISQGNTFYDRRFANNFGPPWFPTAVPQPGSSAIPSSSQITVSRTSWTEDNRNN